MGEWRKVETAPLEGATADHTPYDWQFGGEIDGVFVPAVTKSGGYVDALVARAKETQQQQQQTSDTTAGTPSATAPAPGATTGADNAPTGSQPNTAGETTGAQ